MNEAEKIAWQIVPGPDHIPVQSDPPWIREDIIDVLRPLLTLRDRAVGPMTCKCHAQCLICRHRWRIEPHPDYPVEEPNHADDCPVPAALEARK
jgi:hypothetical protein